MSHACPRRTRPGQRRGATIVLCAVMLVVFLVLTATTINLARLHMVKVELQAAADASALAAGGLMRTTNTSLVATKFSLSGADATAIRDSAQLVASANYAAHLGPCQAGSLCVSRNDSNLPDEDIVVGDYGVASGFTPNASIYNAVKVVVRFAPGGVNGSLPLLLRSVLSRNDNSLSAFAIAKVDRVTLLPFVVFKGQWQALISGTGDDDYTVNDSTVSSGSDGIKETTVFPGDWDGSFLPPGNYGWIDIGGSSNASVIRRQVDEGPNVAEMATHGGKLEAGDFLSGATGIMASTEVAFEGGTAPEKDYDGILGIPRLVALYDQASGSGTNATFRIDSFVMIRVVFVNLSSNPKAIRIQPVTLSDDPQRVRLVK